MIFITTKNLKYKFFYGISAILLLINVMFSQSRNALIALIIGVFIIAILYDKRFFILSLIFPIIFFIIPAIRARVFQIFDMSQNSSRFNIWDVTISMIKDNPIGGIGYENFSIQYPYYISNNPNLIVNDGYLPVHPHNVFLKMQAELGIVGTVIFISFVIITIITLYKLIKSTNNNIHRSVMIGILASYLTFLFMNLLDCYFNTPKVITTMFVILGFANHHRINSSYLQRKS
ncbi:O-antigen ligase family protein [Clostridium saudiense]|nr:O-antigen ligase family protein [Clostridium saudiense]